MPRMVAPPPSGEFSIRLTQSFKTSPTKKIEIIGEPNRSASIKVTDHTGKDNQNILVKTGDISQRIEEAICELADLPTSEDVNELLDVVRPLEGLPTNPNEDVYGFDTRIILSTFEVQWDNGEEVEGAEAPTNPTEENKQTFKDVMDSIMTLVRMKAKKDG